MFDLLPYDIKRVFILQLEIKVLLSICRINREFSSICTESFWNDKYEHDYLPLGMRRNTFLSEFGLQSWKELYSFASKVGTSYPKLSYSMTNEEIIKLHGKIPSYNDIKTFLPVITQYTPNGITISKSDGRIIPLYHSWFVMYDRILMNSFAKDPYIVIDALEVGDSLVLYRTYWKHYESGDIVTRTKDGYTLTMLRSDKIVV